MLRRFVITALAFCALVLAPCGAQDTLQQEADRLATLLKWHAGDAVGEIGAGNGKLTVAASQRVAPSGKVFTNEIDPDALAHLEELAKKERNITVVKGAEGDTNLPPECCSSIFMRLVYHHLTKPAEMDASLLRSLKSGGLLAVIDEEPREGSSVPEGVPKDRAGHGIPQKILIRELTGGRIRGGARRERLARPRALLCCLPQEQTLAFVIASARSLLWRGEAIERAGLSIQLRPRQPNARPPPPI